MALDPNNARVIRGEHLAGRRVGCGWLLPVLARLCGAVLWGLWTTRNTRDVLTVPNVSATQEDKCHSFCGVACMHPLDSPQQQAPSWDTPTRSPQPEHQQQQTADPALYDTFTGILGPTTDDASGIIDVIKSTIKPLLKGSPSSFIVAVTPGPSSQNGLWSTFSKFAAKPTSTVIIASGRINAAVMPDTTTSAQCGDEYTGIVVVVRRCYYARA
ncbi:hypothetical protein F5888DRAFT_1636195 [Russula emetica]|nr:hypothetical protein F5888DRAFT_1636195 [Russula emetica]